MPAMKVAMCCNGRSLTTRPFAGDDFQIVCILNGLFRLITLICATPLWIKIFSFRMKGVETASGNPSWCRYDQIDPWTLYFTLDGDQLEILETGYQNVGDVSHGEHHVKQMVIPFSLYLIISLLYNALDIILSLAIWNAAAIGTPVEPRGREKALVSMVWIKITFMNLLLLAVLGSGIFLTYTGREYNYGCDVHQNSVEYYENSIWYGFFSASMAVYAVELLMWPCIIMNQVGNAIALQSRRISLIRSGLTDDKEGFCAQCIGCCIQCIRFLSCNRMGGGSIKAKSDLRDAAVAFMDFFNHEANLDIVLSDVYVAFKLIHRKRREKKYKLSKQAKLDNAQSKAELGNRVIGDGDKSNRSSPASAIHFSGQYASILNRTVLSGTDATDMFLLRQGARYSQYSMGVYKNYPLALVREGLLDRWDGLYSPWKPGDQHSLLSTIRLTEFGFPKTALIYANFTNKVMATPYCILLDDAECTLVVVIRGSVTLEDLVTDLQWSAIELDRAGEKVGFDGRGKYCHRGILVNSKWIYNDIHRRKIISSVLGNTENNNPFRDYKLIITGHSLGAACAAVLTTLLKPKYPNVKCYAFCPPGCTVSMNLATECDEFVTSFVVGNDIIPRMRGENIEMLRYEFIEMLARIKVSKIAAFRDIRSPCKNKDLEVRNKRVLYGRKDIPPTEYYQRMISFRERREQAYDQLNPVESRLHIPGRVIHLVRVGDETDNKYLPYYTTRKIGEIHFCSDSVKDHSILGASEILGRVVSEFENVSSIVSHDDDDISVQSENSFGDDSISEDPWFMWCSHPRGLLVSFLPTILAVLAVCFSVTGNNMCTLFSRQIIDRYPYNNMTDKEDYISNITGVSYGLYFYGVEYLNEDSETHITNCKTYPSSNVVNDSSVKSARAFSAITLVIGFPCIFLLFLTSCMTLGDRTLVVMTILLMLAAICQSMIFLCLSSGRCVDPAEPMNLPSNFVWAQCTLNYGSKTVIIASVLWCLAAVSLGSHSQLSRVAKRIRSACNYG